MREDLAKDSPFGLRLCFRAFGLAFVLLIAVLLRIHRVTLDDVFLDPLWFFNYKKILWGGYRLYVGSLFRLASYGLGLWLRDYLWARLKSICDGFRKGRGVRRRGASRARLGQIAVIRCILEVWCIRAIA